MPFCCRSTRAGSLMHGPRADIGRWLAKTCARAGTARVWISHTAPISLTMKSKRAATRVVGGRSGCVKVPQLMAKAQMLPFTTRLGRDGSLAARSARPAHCGLRRPWRKPPQAWTGTVRKVERACSKRSLVACGPHAMPVGNRARPPHPRRASSSLSSGRIGAAQQ
jgi:hypothetical protein